MDTTEKIIVVQWFDAVVWGLTWRCRRGRGGAEEGRREGQKRRYSFISLAADWQVLLPVFSSSLLFLLFSPFPASLSSSSLFLIHPSAFFLSTSASSFPQFSFIHLAFLLITPSDQRPAGITLHQVTCITSIRSRLLPNLHLVVSLRFQLLQPFTHLSQCSLFACLNHSFILVMLSYIESQIFFFLIHFSYASGPCSFIFTHILNSASCSPRFARTHN